MLFVEFDCLLIEAKGGLCVALLLVNLCALIEVFCVCRLQLGEEEKLFECFVQPVEFEVEL